jgi:phage shock protein A
MLQYLKRRWKYMSAKLSGRFEETADPKVQLEQAIREAHDQHRRLKEQAANVIANQKQTEMRLNRSIEDLEHVNANARQAVVMAEDAATAGEAERATSYTKAAEQFANRLITLEQEIESLKSLHFQATEAADQAKAAVSQNSAALQQKLRERQKLLGQLDQAKMQEQVNSAMSILSEEIGQDVPTFNEVREKIEARYAKAKGTAELVDSGVESRMLEIEEAARNTEARARLDEIKAQLGLGVGEAAAAELPEGDHP